MDRNEAIAVIVAATKWLTVSGETHTGVSYGNTYVMTVEAGTPDLKLHVRGVYFGHEVECDATGTPIRDKGIRLFDHADPDSWHDFVPRRLAEDGESDRLGMEDTEYVDVEHLLKIGEERLFRMAANAERIMHAYGVFPTICGDGR